MIDDRPFDVAIAGAGLAGASLALRLARAGARVAVVDPGRFPREKLCGEFLSPEAWGALVDLGADGDVEGSGFEPIRSVRLTTPSGRSIVAPVAGPDGRPGIGLSRFRLDDLLLRRAVAAGAIALESTRVSGPLLDADRVVGLACRGSSNGPVEVRARLCVAADGRGSALVRRTGRTRPRGGRRPPLMGLKRHYFTRDDHPAAEPPGTVGLHSLPGGYVGASRVDRGLTNLCGLVPEALARGHRGDLDALAAALAARNPALGRLVEASAPAGPWKAVAGVRVEASSPTVSHLFYAGDCRGTVDPLGGQGMTMALLGASDLAPLVLSALRPGADPAAVNRAYEAAWHARFDRRIDLCRLFHHLLTRPGLLDLGSTLPRLASAILAHGYRRTRDDRRVVVA